MRKISSIILVAFITTSILPMDLWAGEGASALAVQAARGKVVAGGKPASRLDDLFAHLRNPEQALSARQAILGNLELVGLQESRLEYIIFSSVRALADEASQPHAQWILINIARQSQRHKEKVTRILGEYFAHEALTIAITDTLFEIAEVTDWEDRFSNARKRHPEYTCGMVVSVIPDKGCWVIFYDEDRSVYVAGYIERAEVRYSLNKGRYVSDLKKLIQPGNCYYGRKQKSLISHTEPDKLVGIFTRGQEPGYRVAGNIVADIKRTIALIDNFDPREKLKEIAAKGRYENLAVLIGLAEAVIFFSQPNDQERAESLIAEFLNDDCFGDLLKYLSGNFKETEKRPYIINSARELIHRIASQAGCFESRDAVEGELAVVLTPTQGGCYVILETGSYGYIKLLTLQRDLGGGRPGTLSKNLVTPGELFAVEHDPIGGKYRDIPVTSVRRLPDAIVAGAQPDPYASGLDELELGRKHGGNPGGSDDSEVSITAIIDTQVANLPQASATRKLLQLAREGYASLIAEKVQPALTNEFMATRNAARNILGIIDDEGLEQSHEPVSDEAIKAGLMSVELLFSQLPADLVTVSAKITAIAQQTANSRVAVDIVRLSTQALLDPITRPYGKQILISLIDKQSEPIRINAKRLLNNEDEEVLEACADILFAVEGIEDWREKLAEAAEQAGGGLTGMVVDIFENSAACQLILHQPLEGRRRSAFIPVSILKDDLNDGKHISDINDIAPRGTCITGEYRKTGQGGIGLGGLCWPDDPRGGYRGSRNADFIKQRIRALANVVHRNPIAREELLRYSREGFLDQVVGCVKMKAMFNSREKIRIACRDLLVEIADTDQYSRLLKIVGLNHLDSHPIETMELLSYIFANSNKLKQKLQAAEAFAEPGEVVGLALCRDRRKIGCLLALSDGSFGYFGVGAVKSLAQRLRAEGFNTSDYLGEGACIVGKSGELGDSRFGQVRFLSSDIRLARDGRCGRSIDQQAEQGKTEADKAEPAKVKVEELPSLDKVLTIREVIEKVDITLSPRFAVFNTGTPNEIGSQVADLVYDAVRFAEENKHGLTVEELESFIFILMADKNNNMYRKVINGLSKTFLTNNDSLVALGKQFFNKMFYYEEYEDDDYTDNVRRSVFVRLTKIALKKSAPARDNAMSMLTNFAEAGYAHYFAQCASGYILSEVDRADVIGITLKLCAGIDNWKQYLRTAIERIQTEDDEIVVMAVSTRNYQGVPDDKKGFYVIGDFQGQVPDLKFIRQDTLVGLGEVKLGTILTARLSDSQYWEGERRSFPVVVNPRKPVSYAGAGDGIDGMDGIGEQGPDMGAGYAGTEETPEDAAPEITLSPEEIKALFKRLPSGEVRQELLDYACAADDGMDVFRVIDGAIKAMGTAVTQEDGEWILLGLANREFADKIADELRHKKGQLYTDMLRRIVALVPESGSSDISEEGLVSEAIEQYLAPATRDHGKAALLKIGKRGVGEHYILVRNTLHTLLGNDITKNRLVTQILFEIEVDGVTDVKDRLKRAEESSDKKHVGLVVDMIPTTGIKLLMPDGRIAFIHIGVLRRDIVGKRIHELPKHFTVGEAIAGNYKCDTPKGEVELKNVARVDIDGSEDLTTAVADADDVVDGHDGFGDQGADQSRRYDRKIRTEPILLGVNTATTRRIHSADELREALNYNRVIFSNFVYWRFRKLFDESEYPLKLYRLYGEDVVYPVTITSFEHLEGVCRHYAEIGQKFAIDLTDEGYSALQELEAETVPRQTTYQVARDGRPRFGTHFLADVWQDDKTVMIDSAAELENLISENCEQFLLDEEVEYLHLTPDEHRRVTKIRLAVLDDVGPEGLRDVKVSKTVPVPANLVEAILVYHGVRNHSYLKTILYTLFSAEPIGTLEVLVDERTSLPHYVFHFSGPVSEEINRYAKILKGNRTKAELTILGHDSAGDELKTIDAVNEALAEINTQGERPEFTGQVKALFEQLSDQGVPLFIGVREGGRKREEFFTLTQVICRVGNDNEQWSLQLSPVAEKMLREKMVVPRPASVEPQASEDSLFAP